MFVIKRFVITRVDCILYYKHHNVWNISDLGFCEPTDKPLKSIYENLLKLFLEKNILLHQIFIVSVYPSQDLIMIMTLQ